MLKAELDRNISYFFLKKIYANARGLVWHIPGHVQLAGGLWSSLIRAAVSYTQLIELHHQILVDLDYV
jgi:hypothetical protein